MWSKAAGKRICRLRVAGVLGGALVAAPPAAAGDAAYGAYLAAECVTCHQPEAKGAIPPIAGMKTASFVKALHEYRAGHRPNPIMQNVARSLDDDQVEALATYFASLEAKETTREAK